MFFWKFFCFFYDPMGVGNFISGPSTFSKSSLYIWKFSVHVLLKLSLKDFEHYLASMWNECICEVVWTFLWHCPSLGLEWKLTFSSPVTTAEFSKFVVSLETISLHTKILQYHWPCSHALYYIPITCLLCNWRFVSLNLIQGVPNL